MKTLWSKNENLEKQKIRVRPENEILIIKKWKAKDLKMKPKETENEKLVKQKILRSENENLVIKKMKPFRSENENLVIRKWKPEDQKMKTLWSKNENLVIWKMKILDENLKIWKWKLDDQNFVTSSRKPVKSSDFEQDLGIT